MSIDKKTKELIPSGKQKVLFCVYVKRKEGTLKFVEVKEFFTKEPLAESYMREMEDVYEGKNMVIELGTFRENGSYATIKEVTT